MAIGTKNHPDVGRCVEIPAYADMWMRGARFGTVERVIDRSSHKRLDPRDCSEIYRVRLDHPQARGKLYSYHGPDCRIIKGDA